MVYPAGMELKQRAGEAAVEFVQSGMTVGLGTGSTAKFFIQGLASAIRSGKLLGIRGVPTSVASERLAREAGVPIASFSDINEIHVTVDGADEIAPDLTLIKGLGGALMREKLVAQCSQKLVIIADESKLVSALGTRCPLPVEVTAFGHELTEKFLRGLGCEPVLRRHVDGATFLTDNGNYIFDCKFAGIPDPKALESTLALRAGVVESGLFIGLASIAIVAMKDSIKTLTVPA